jgi:hypothetical protein
MSSLEQSITEWRQTMSGASKIGPDTLAELERISARRSSDSHARE